MWRSGTDKIATIPPGVRRTRQEHVSVTAIEIATLPTMNPAGWMGAGGLVFRSASLSGPTRRSMERALGGDAIRRVVDEARSGDTNAFALLFSSYESDVKRLCRRMLGSGPTAEDAASEVFLRARRGIGSYDPARPFRPWLLAIAGHHCIDQLRRRSSEARLFDSSDLEPEDLAAPGPSPLTRLIRAEQREALDTAIDLLPHKYRLPLVLRYFSELEYGAIAELLGVRRNQVGTLLFRAKRRLREQLSQDESS